MVTAERGATLLSIFDLDGDQAVENERGQDQADVPQAVQVNVPVAQPRRNLDGLNRIFDAFDRAARANPALVEARNRIEAAVYVNERTRTLNAFCDFADFSDEQLRLDEIQCCRELFLMSHGGEVNGILKEALDLADLKIVDELVRISIRYKVRMEDLEDELELFKEPIVEVNGWRLETSLFGEQFVNNEGLTRSDPPRGWDEEEFHRDKLIRETNEAIVDMNEFVLARLQKELLEVKEWLDKCNAVIDAIDYGLDNPDQEIIDARNLLENVIKVILLRVLRRFNFEQPRTLTAANPVGITNLYVQRRARYRPNYHADLVAYFDNY